MTGKIKRMFLLNLPYVLIALGATKIGEAWRFSVGVDISQKVLHLMEGFILAFHSPLAKPAPTGPDLGHWDGLWHQARSLCERQERQEIP